MADFTFAVLYKGSDARHRAKSVLHVQGVPSIKEAMDAAKAFVAENPDKHLGACLPGLHAFVP